ncbi:hypothetical protein BDB00DRAFT_879766 [Zychaea mexicana]|uniref:uncharacterized protein n=1 Tax=Zychaea mexicana TaxID=64656 RepID=UPI0022FDB9D8|nr:uncharacterized protein BDB00DRAFT_879766 [Zychaea mexicana]KAI9473383.1 hypothetical protein BDB00DRAFT_879766 [Zychaea mexicana]
MFRCIVNGGYFPHVASGRLVHASNKIIDFVRANDSFRKLYFGADRENVDNNEHKVTLKRGVSGLFRIRKSSGCQDVLAEITSLNKHTGAVYFKLFKPVITPYPTVDFSRLSSAYTTNFSTSIYTNTSKDDAANVRLRRSGTSTLEVHLSEISLLEALDIQVQATGQQERIINIGKFGSLWRLLVLAPEEVSSL